jgi:hypothetical protein
MKALLSFRITVDHEDRHTPVVSHVKLYREDDGLIWRIEGPNGDSVDVLPRPKTVEQAKADVRAAYPLHSPFKPWAIWY